MGFERPVQQRKRKIDLDEVVAEAARLFHERGYHKTSVEDIGAAVGVTGPALYHHFKNKEGLLRAVLFRAFTQWEAAVGSILSEEGEPAELLEKFIRAHVDVLSRERDVMALAATELRDTPPEDRAVYARVTRRLRRQTDEILKRIRPDLTDAERRVAHHTTSAMIQSIASLDPSVPAGVVADRTVKMVLAALLQA